MFSKKPILWEASFLQKLVWDKSQPAQYIPPGLYYSLSAFKWHKRNIRNLLMRSSEIALFFYLHFTWLYDSWHFQRIWKKYPFWKYDSWFSSEMSKLTSVRNELNLSWKYWFIEQKLFFVFPKMIKISFRHTADYIRWKW